MKTLPTPKEGSSNGKASCVPYTVIVSSRGWATSASHTASHQRRRSSRSPDTLDTTQANERRGEREPEKRVRFGPVQRHVANRVAVIDERVETRQRAAHPAPQCGLPQGGASPHDRHADGSAQRKLRQRVHR